MRKRTGSALRIVIPFMLIVPLVLGTAFPVFADSTIKSKAGLRLIQGDVISITSDNSTSDNVTVVISNGNQQVDIKVDGNTKYYMLPSGNTAPASSAAVQPKTTNKELLKENLAIANCRRDPNAFGRYGKAARLSDVAVGDRIIAWVKTADNMATQILIIKPPIYQNVKGIVTFVSDISFTITTNTGTAVTLSWDENTRCTLKGFISVQNGQYATAVYNRNTMVARTVEVQATAPPSATVQAP